MEKQAPRGMTAFIIVWIGQFISLFGSSMTQFALTIWAYQVNQRATDLALVGLFSFAPTVILSPIAGALIDRWNRKLVMMISDLAAGLSTVAIFILFQLDVLQIWHLYIAGFFAGAFQAFQFPAYSASVTLMLPKEQYARASGLLSLAGSASSVFAPALAGFFLVIIGIEGIMLIDIVTFLAAIGTLIFVFIPQPKETAEGAASRGNLLKESLFGFKYIFERPSLLGLQLMFFMLNFIAVFGFTLLAPMVLARTGSSEIALGSVQSIMGIGGVLGGILMSTWGGPKRRVHGVLFGMALISLSQVLVGVGQGVPFWAAGMFLAMFIMPILNGSNQAIWQAKVAPDVQGRVFSARRLIAQIAAPISIGLAGPLADFVFEPALAEGGALVTTFGPIVGTGPGAGMGLIFVIAGSLGVLTGLSGFLFGVVRNAEDILPDHKAEILEESTETPADIPATAESTAD